MDLDIEIEYMLNLTSLLKTSMMTKEQSYYLVNGMQVVLNASLEMEKKLANVQFFRGKLGGLSSFGTGKIA